MLEQIQIGLIGDYNPQVTAHVAIPQALAIAGEQIGVPVTGVWLATESLGDDVSARLAEFDGLWCVPASPYVNMDGAIAAIRFARERGLPFLGTCGGYQHALLEYARNALGYDQAGNAEVDPESAMPLISALSCALVEKDGEIEFAPGSRLAEIYGTQRTIEQYHCSYGLNLDYISIFADSDLMISGTDKAGEPRAFELKNHPFFIGTGYQPERSALKGKPHALITAYVRAMSTVAMRQPS